MISRLRWALINVAAAGRVPAMLTMLLGLAALAAGADAWQAHRQQEIEQQHAFALRRDDARAAAAPTRSMDADVDTLLSKLPDTDEWGAQLRQLFELAADSGLRLEQGEYATTARPGSLLKSLHVTLPIKGEPARVARFVAAVNARLPAVAVDSIAIKRASAEGGIVEAKVALVLFMNARSVR